MNKEQRLRMTALVVLALILSVVLTACGSSNTVATTGSTGSQTAGSAAVAQSQPETTKAPQAAALTQTNNEGEVTVEVTWQGASAGLVFEVVMDTHSVDLDGYDLMTLAVLRTDQGQEVKPSGWDAPKGGHHRRGTLAFPDKAADGSPLIGPNTRTIELVIRDVAGVPERVFKWTL